MIHDLIYNGKNLRSFGFAIKERPFYSIAERDFELTDIIGGNGAVITDNGGYKNVEFSYAINSIPYWCSEKTEQQLAQEIIDWLYNFDGDYRLLRDTYNNGYFCYAICKTPEKISSVIGKSLDTTVTFSRKPFWYSDLGQQQIISHPENGNKLITKEIFNPESYFSEPYIKVTANAAFSLKVNDITMKVASCNGYLEFDCEAKNVFKDSIHKNDIVSGDYFPTFKPGLNTITVTSNSDSLITKLEIIPRWRRL